MKYKLIPAFNRFEIPDQIVAEQEIYRKIYTSPEELKQELQLSVSDSLAVAKLAVSETLRVIAYVNMGGDSGKVEECPVFVVRQE